MNRKKFSYWTKRMNKVRKQTNNKSVAVNISFSERVKKKSAYILKGNTKQKKVILLMGTDNQKWHYRTVKNLSRSFQEITSKSKLESHGSFCKNYDYCHLQNAL